jgi:hypothetical protein
LQTSEKDAIDYIRCNHSRAVLQENRRQKEEGLDEIDWEKLKEASTEYSGISLQRALELAQQDEQENDLV